MSGGVDVPVGGQRAVNGHDDAAAPTGDTQFQQLIESIPAAVLIHSGHKYVYANPAAERLTGYARHELLSMDFWQWIHPEFQDLAKSRGLARQRGESVPTRCELKVLTKAGDERWIHMAVARVLFDGRWSGLFTIFDITDQKRAAQALKASEAKSFQVMEGTPAATFICQSDSVVYANAAAERLTGYSRDELIGMPFRQLAHPEFRDLIRNRANARRRGEYVPSRYEIKMLPRTGEGRWIEITVSQTEFDGKDALFGVVFDITEQKETAAALAGAEAQLQQAKKMEAVGQLAAGIAHDFGNTLTTIIGFSSLVLARVSDRPDIVEDVEEIRKAGERASQLTRKLLTFSRGQLLVSRVLDLNHVLDGLTKMLTSVLGQNIRFEAITEPLLDHTKTDAGQVEQLLLNLAINARDAMPRGGTLTIATSNVVLDDEFVRSHPGAVQGAYVSLAVQDTGCGMSPDVLAHVFEPFFTTKRSGQGTGLGLASAYGLLKQSGGYITAESTPDVGTVVTTYWPVVYDEVNDAELTPRVELAPSGTETILLVEDQADVRAVMRRLLEQNGYKVIQAEDASRAIVIEASYDEPIDLLVTDIVIPGLNGVELAAQIVERRPEMEVLLVTGYATREAVDRGLNDLHAGLIRKPFIPALFAQEVRACLDGARRRLWPSGQSSHVDRRI